MARLGAVPVAFFLIVVVAAGASGVALLTAPGSTDRYFSWRLRPPGAAALIGGQYLASAVVFAWGLTLSGREARALVVGVLGLAVPTLVLTIVHDEVFDFGRWQALAWVGLFVTAPFSATVLLAARRPSPAGDPGGGALPAVCRAGLALLALALAAVAVLIWFDATRDDVIRASPVDLVRLTGTYLGAWCSFLAMICGFAALTGPLERGPGRPGDGGGGVRRRGGRLAARLRRHPPAWPVARRAGRPRGGRGRPVRLGPTSPAGVARTMAATSRAARSGGRRRSVRSACRRGPGRGARRGTS